MKSFEIESMKDQIYFGKTKEYFNEVLISYQVGSYRSSVVMLWSVAVADVVYKLQHLVDLYNDDKANAILTTMREIKNENIRSSTWELNIIETVFKQTNLIDSADYENLRYLQKQRHLCAHPVLRENLDLHKPNKETVRALIRNTLEGLLIKPPFYTQKVISEVLEDLNETKVTLNTYKKLKRYIENRYLNRMSEDVEMALFKKLWKFTFKLENKECDDNRNLNLNVIKVITERNKSKIIDIVKGDKDYYSNIASKGHPLDFMVYYLSKNNKVYDVLLDEAKLKIQHASNNTQVGKICGWFIRGGISDHFDFIMTWMESDNFPELSDDQWQYIFELSDSDEWQMKYTLLISNYYCLSSGYNTADSRCSQCIIPNLKYFDKESAEYLLSKIETNNQVYNRSRAYAEHSEIRKHFNTILPEDFDYTKYKNFDKTSKAVVD